ncbi:SOS response-associated peptidase [Luteimonas sp. FXH3W]|uniref:Abasic site processing protein n=1 Tax=Aquilutibacter rugosus TaxID=3115820 RepID=A0ABU7V0M0_9GAMM
MCGRFAQVLLKSHLPPGMAEHLRDELNEHIRPRFNIAPTAAVATVAHFEGKDIALPMQWGLVPGWKKDLSPPHPINARIETVDTSGMFRGAYRYRHCVIPARNYYEWIAGPAPKQPYAIAHATDEALWFAGLFELWTDAGNSALLTFTIVTKPANGIADRVHSRMPVMLRPELVMPWLHATEPKESMRLLMEPAPPLAIFPVSKRVNNARNEESDLAEPIGEIETEAAA